MGCDLGSPGHLHSYVQDPGGEGWRAGLGSTSLLQVVSGLSMWLYPARLSDFLRWQLRALTPSVAKERGQKLPVS